MRLGVIVIVLGSALAVVLVLWPDTQAEPRHLREHDARDLPHPFMAGGALKAAPEGN